MARGIWECGWEVEKQGRLLLGGNSMDQSRSSLYKSTWGTAEAGSTWKSRQALKKARTRAYIYKPDPKLAFTEYYT